MRSRGYSNNLITTTSNNFSHFSDDNEIDIGTDAEEIDRVSWKLNGKEQGGYSSVFYKRFFTKNKRFFTKTHLRTIKNFRRCCQKQK